MSTYWHQNCQLMDIPCRGQVVSSRSMNRALVSPGKTHCHCTTAGWFFSYCMLDCTNGGFHTIGSQIFPKFLKMTVQDSAEYLSPVSGIFPDLWLSPACWTPVREAVSSVHERIAAAGTAPVRCRGLVPSVLPVISLWGRNCLGHTPFDWFKHMHPSKCWPSFN